MFSPIIILFSIVLLAVSLLIYKRWQKKRILNSPFPASWQQILLANLPIYRKLPAPLSDQLHREIRRFLHDKTFYGCNGLVMTDEIRVTIAGEACLLLLNRKTNHYYQLHYILVYPTSFVVSREQRSEQGVVSQTQVAVLGESWQQGKVILSWQGVLSGAKNFSDGHNVVLHEFAHQLDQESGSANGAPLLGSRSSYRRWASVLAAEFAQLQQHSGGYRQIIDQYGATNPAEFFAVVTETFFERPLALQKKHPQLFAEFEDFYAVNPSDWQ